jgi:5-methylcytosine-specific restriction endonuclease McrA
MKSRALWNGKRRGLLLTRLFARDGDRCGICAGKLDRYAPEGSRNYVTIDHRMPLAHGGRDTIENLQLAHERCNEERGDAYDPEFDAPRKRKEG